MYIVRISALNYLVLLFGVLCEGGYNATWESLDSRPLPQWYDEAKIGIFMHWGLYSVPALGSEWMWAYWNGNPKGPEAQFMEKNFRPNFTYQDFGPSFTAEFYNPDEWAELFKASGAKYVVLTSKHHEGFTMWPSKHAWNWNVMDVGPNRDLVGDLAQSIRSKTPDIHFGLYYSLYEWYNPLYRLDKDNKYTTRYFPTQKMTPELHDLIDTYKPEILWVDGDWEAHDDYWGSLDFLSWLFNDSPVNDTVVVNDRWGIGDPCKHGSYYTCTDRFNPGTLQPHKWESAMTLDKTSWAYRRNAALHDYLSIEELLTKVAMTISCGGNILIDFGPTHDGRVPILMEERLRQLGAWLNINGEAIYSTVPWKYQNDTTAPGVWYTSKNTTVYAIVLNWPVKNKLTLGSVQMGGQSTITFLGHDSSADAYKTKFIKETSKEKSTDGATEITFPPMSSMSSQWAWVIKMEGVQPTGMMHSNTILSG